MSSRHFADDVIGEHTMPFEDVDRHIVDPVSRRSNHSSDSSRGGGNLQSSPFMIGTANFTNGLLAADDQRLLALVDAANVAPIGVRLTPPPPPYAATSSTRRPSLSPAATPPPGSLPGAASPTPHYHNVPTDYERCHLGLQQLQASLTVARRVDDLARTLKYVNDDITSLAISSFSSNDLWRSLGYRGTPDDAKFQLRKRRLDIKAAMMRAAAMGESVSARPPSSSGAMIRKISTAFLKDTPRSSSMKVAGDGGSVSDVPLPAGQQQQPRPSSSSNNKPPPLDLRLTSAARFAEVCKFGGVLADESTEILVTFQEFVTQLAEGKFTSPDVFRTLLEFPPASGASTPSPSSGNISASRRGSTDSLRTPLTSEVASKGPSDIGTSPLSLKRQQQRRNSAGGGPPTPPPKGGAPSASPPPTGTLVIEEAMKIKAARQKELDIKCKFAHDLEIRSLCIEEERRFQRIFVLEVLSLIAVQQLEQEIDLAKQRLRTCEVLKHRSDANPERGASDTDMQQCIELIPTLKETIGHSVQQIQVFEQKLHRRFNRALTDSVKELCGFNREVHCWNHYVDRRARRHANAKRRTLQSLFTALSKLETGELSLDKNPEVFIKVQLFEKMDSTITLARQAQDMLARYKQRLAALDKLPNGKITTADLERWTVELKQRGAAGGRRKSAAQGTAKKKKSGVSPPQSTLGSVKSLGSKVAKSLSGGGTTGGQSGGASSRSRRSSIASSNHSGGDGGGGGDSGDDKKKPSKRWRFKLYDETHDEERYHQYEALLDAESDVVLSSVEAILSMLSESVNLWASPNIAKTSSSSNLPRVSSGQRQRSNSFAVKLPSRPTSSAPPIPPPRPVKFFYVALLSVVSDVLDAFHVEISRWDDADLVIDTDDDNDDTEAAEPSATEGGGKKAIGGSQDPLNRSMSSSFGGSSAASSMGSAPSAHVPSWIDEEEQRKNAYRTTVLRLTNLKQSLQQLVEQVFGSFPPFANEGSRSGGGGGSVVGFLKKYDPTKHQRHNNGRRVSHDPTSNSDDTLFRVFEPPAENHSVTPPLAAMRGSPSTPHDGASTSAALIPLSLVNTQPDPVPLPACLVELEERERDLIILRPGELLLPPSDPPLWMSGGGGAEVVVDDDGSLPQTILPGSSSPKNSSSHRGPSFLERLIKMMRKDEQSNDLHRGALSLETHQPFWRRKGSAAGAGAVNHNDSGAPPSSQRRGTKVPTSQANALRSLGEHVMHHPHHHHGNSARPPTAPKPSSSQQQVGPPNSSRRPHHTNVQQHHMVGGARDWTRRWSADTTGAGGSRSQQQLNGSTPVSPTGMPEAYSWTPGGSPGTAALRAPKPHPHHHPNSDPLRYYGELPTLGEDELDGGFAPWGGTGTSGGGGLGSYEGADSWRTSRPGTGSNHAAALKEAKLRLAPRPRGSGSGGGSDVVDRRWSPTKPFR